MPDAPVSPAQQPPVVTRGMVVTAVVISLVLAASSALGRWFEISNRDAVANGGDATMQGPLMLGLLAMMIPLVVLIVYGAQLGSAVAVARMRREAERDRPLGWWPSVAGSVGLAALILALVVVAIIGLGWVLTDVVLSGSYPNGVASDDPIGYLAVALMLFACASIAALPSAAIATAVARNRLGISSR